MSVLDRLPEGARVAIIRLRSLGDCVLTTPAIALLKEARPDLQIGVVTEERFEEIFAGNPAIAQVIAPTWQAVRRWKPALCVNLHGGTRSQVMTALSGARWRAGFAHHSTTLAYNIRIPRAQRVLGVHRRVHTAEHLASAFFALGVALKAVPRAQLFAREMPLTDRHAVLHPFASTPEKQWAADRFAEVARYLQLWNITPVFLAGPNDDTTPFAAHAVLKGSLEQAKGVLANAALALKFVRIERALGDALVLAERARLLQQPVDQGGLAVVDVGDDGDVAQVHFRGILDWSMIFPENRYPLFGIML